MEYLGEHLFNWSRWRSGSPADLSLACRTEILVLNKRFIRKYAVGYCDAERLVCRPKVNHKAVMFFKDGFHFWFHLTNKEFYVINERN